MSKTPSTSTGAEATGHVSFPGTLYARLGGEVAVANLVDSFRACLAKNGQLYQKIEAFDVAEIDEQVRLFLGQAFGGPSFYQGPTFKEACSLAGWTPEEVELLFGYFQDALGELDAPKDVVRETLDAIEALRPEVAESTPVREPIYKNIKEESAMPVPHSGDSYHSPVPGAMDPDAERRLGNILDVLTGAAAGDLTGRVSSTGDDVVGRIGRQVEKLLSELRSSMSSVHTTATSLGSSADEFGLFSQELRISTERTSSQANVVAESAEQVNRNVHTVATAAEEMAIGVRDIAKNASDAARVATGAVQMAQATNATISKLGDSSTEIGKVIKVITSIAQQTNLLALNATIEAARAGEVGKGFAVVANEVKELAKETAKATEDISQKIEAIQNDTKSAVSAIEEISGVINQINDFQSSIASAVEEQTATTNEISRSVSEAARGSQEIAQNITNLAQGADSIAGSAESARTSFSELAKTASDLQKLVAQFNI